MNVGSIYTPLFALSFLFIEKQLPAAAENDTDENKECET